MNSSIKILHIEERFKVVTGLGGNLGRFPIKKEDHLDFATDKEKSRTFAEVFTPVYMVDEMLQTIPTNGMTFSTNNLDLCSGHGQFSIRMLRKLYEEQGEAFDVGKYLREHHFFAELQISSCFKLMWIFSLHFSFPINLAIGDALQLGKLPKKAKGIWYYLKELDTWVDITGFVKALYESTVGPSKRSDWGKMAGKLFTYDQSKEDAFVKAFESFEKRMELICKEPKMSIEKIICTKEGRHKFLQILNESASGVEHNWQETATPEWIVREMVKCLPEEVTGLKKILVLFNVEFLECLVREMKVAPSKIDFGYDSEVEGLYARAVYKVHTFSIGKNLTELKEATKDKGGKYDVIFSNPPYQEQSEAQKDREGGGNTQAKPLYHKVVMYSIDVLQPKYLCMITPSRWMVGGMGLGDYRARMLDDKHIQLIQDFPGEKDVFPTVSIKGGVSYFLWHKDYNGLCDFNGVQRNIGEFDVLVRDNTSCQILRKVLSKATDFCNTRVLPNKPFGLPTNYSDWVSEETPGAIECMASGKSIKFVDQKAYTDINGVKPLWKVIVNAVTMEGSSFTGTVRQLLMGFMVLKPNQICTETYIVSGAFKTKKEADNYIEYLKTKFYRFMLSLRVITQHVNTEKFSWVPDLKDYSHAWIDQDLYSHFGITKKEIEHIEKAIKPL